MRATYEHRRWVILSAEMRPYGSEYIPLFTDPLLLNSYQWRSARESGFSAHVLPQGGVTICRVWEEEKDGFPDRLVAETRAECSNDDSYVKATGRIKSLGLAQSALKKRQKVG